jgi:hypothetical protein
MAQRRWTGGSQAASAGRAADRTLAVIERTLRQDARKPVDPADIVGAAASPAPAPAATAGKVAAAAAAGAGARPSDALEDEACGDTDPGQMLVRTPFHAPAALVAALQRSMPPELVPGGEAQTEFAATADVRRTADRRQPTPAVPGLSRETPLGLQAPGGRPAAAGMLGRDVERAVAALSAAAAETAEALGARFGPAHGALVLAARSGLVQIMRAAAHDADLASTMRGR